MELQETLRRRKMVRSFRQDPVDPAVLERIMATVLHAPSAGFSQGVEHVVLTDPTAVAAFRRINSDDDAPVDPDAPELRPPVIVLVLADPSAYTARYAAADKIAFGLDDAANWPVPYWDVDAGMATMLILLGAVEEGLGAYFAGLFEGGRPTLEHFGVPDRYHCVGFVGLGHPAEEDPNSAGSSAFSRRRRPLDEIVHRERW